MMHSKDPWYRVKDTSMISSPALLFYPDRIRENIDLMIEIAGGPERLRPHVKTHKNAEIIRLQQDKGIQKFKCATLSEARLLGLCGAEDILLAMQPVGPNIEGFFHLMEEFPESLFSTLVDNRQSLDRLASKAKMLKQRISLWLDLNNGMNRTGIHPGTEAEEIFKAMYLEPWVEARGLHAYDGHIRHTNLDKRKKQCKEAFLPVEQMRVSLERNGIPVKRIVAGGSPSFGIHAANGFLELSPGTTLLWDAGYGNNFPDLPFKIAATLLSRVISKPGQNLICTDLGHKSVASEMPFPRVVFQEHADIKQVGHSEEHLILESEEKGLDIGKELYAVPMHICPTVSKYAKAYVIKENTLNETWEIQARDH